MTSDSGFVRAFHGLNRGLVSIETFLMAAFTVALVGAIFIEVVCRYLLFISTAWSEELARYLFIWMVYLAIGYAAKQRKHIKIDAALWLFPQRIRPYICIVGDIVVLLFSAFIIKTSYELFMKIAMLGQKSAAMGIPMQFVYMAPFVGFVLTFYRTLQTIWLRVKCLRQGGALDD